MAAEAQGAAEALPRGTMRAEKTSRDAASGNFIVLAGKRVLGCDSTDLTDSVGK